MKKSVGLLLGSVILVITGYYIGTGFFKPEPEHVVLYESAPQEQKMAVVPAAFISNGTETPSLQAFNEAFVKIAKNVNPSIVTITTEKVIKTRVNPVFPGFGDDDFFRKFFDLPEGWSERKATTLGSGVIVDKKGYILTNNHVVEKGEKIKVKLIDKKEYKAEIIGTDPRTDLAVIKIKAKDLKPAILGDSDALKVGEWVLAIGSPFSENLAHTVTAGIVSAKGRSNIIPGASYESFIQTDAAINPGNSGGALVNIRGELVGINTAIATNGAVSGNLGIGFAIPINLAKSVMSDLIEKGKVIRAWLGVKIQPVDDRTARAMKIDTRDGALIAEVVEDSPAEESGIKVGDVIIKFDGKKVEDPSHLQNLVSNSEIGKVKDLVVIRGKKERKLKVKLGELPESIETASRSTGKSFSKLGIQVEELTPYLAQEYGYDSDDEGVIVTRIDRESEAARVLRPGDIIQRIGDKKTIDMSDYKNALEDVSGEFILVLIKRKSGTFFVTLEVPK